MGSLTEIIVFASILDITIFSSGSDVRDFWDAGKF